MQDNKNMVLFIVLSALILLGWSFLSDKVMPTAGPQTQKVQNGKVVATPQPQASPAALPATLQDRAAVLGATPRLPIDTPALKGSINLKGARFDDLDLVTQRETIAPNSPPVRLLSPAGAKGAYFAGFGWSGQGVAVPGPDTVWTASAPVLKPGAPVTLSWTNPTGQTFQLIVSVDDNYLFTVRQRVANAGPNAISVTPYGLVNRAEASPDKSMWTNHVGPVSYLGGKANYGVDWKDLDKDPAGTTTQSNGGWLGFSDKYWLTALAPAGNAPIAASVRKAASGAYQADYSDAPELIAPGQAVSTDAHLFAGAKDYDLLQKYEAQGIPQLNRAIDWGWFRFFMIPIFRLLLWLFHVTGNFGVAIICLTLIVRGAMFPIADKQFKSMAAMRTIQPKMKAIQERYKDDKPRQQQEILKLYQEEKVNPAAGCLPILIQVPIFYALYKVLMVSVEMRHQPFGLWIHDLSAPDPMTPVNLFGLLHFTPPAFLAIGVLPIIMGITMYMQFKLNPQQMDPIQQQMFSIMPWFLMVIMAPYAAGLLLYWCCSNILTLLQQKWLYHRYGLTKTSDAQGAVPAK
ncbi:membrane protein insertase YidC [Sphingomonas sp. ASV193]|uniref:membrane protein insertase YidC n=1 Tax=Sphingomonas sp. ASV193 TaxID=3144405 RepID=UPI0032E8EC9B